MATSPDELVLLISDNVWEREGDTIRSFAPHIRPLIYKGEDPLPQDQLDTVDIAFFSSDLWPERSRGIVLSILKSPHLKWLHTFSAGVDSPFFVQLLEQGIRISNSSGATASPIAQTTILYMLALSRNVRAWMQHQSNHEWTRHEFTELDGSRLAVIGLGPIGLEIARLAIALNMHVEGIRRTPDGTEPCTTFGFDKMHEVVSKADWVAVALPLTPNTTNIFDAAFFSAMKKGAYFVNVGRGELVDETQIIAALQSGHLAGAALDVFATEPLPEDSPLWEMPNVIITPHSSGASHNSALRAEKIFVENLRRFVADGSLTNEVK